jgi:glc operon protein GlcG
MIDLTLELANTVASAALAKAQELGVSITVSIVDESGRLVLCMRGNNLSFLTPEFAQAKAVAAVAFRKGTDELAISREKFPAFWGTVPSIASEPLLPSKGGVPLRVNGHVIGAVGCSGASSEEDHECAIAGASKAGLFHSKI